MMKVAQRNGMALGDASEELQKNRDVVMEAVQHGLAPQFASKELQSDREVMMEAVRQNGLALQFASKGLQSDRDVVMEAVRQNCNQRRWKSDKRAQSSNRPRHFGIFILYLKDPEAPRTVCMWFSQLCLQLFALPLSYCLGCWSRDLRNRLSRNISKRS